MKNFISTHLNRSFFRVVFLGLSSLGLTNAHSQSLTSGWISKEAISSSSRSVEVKPLDSVQALPDGTKLGPPFLEKAEEIAQKPHNIGLLLMERGEVVFQKLSSDIPETSALLGYSMTKSVTSLLAGYALCSGAIKSLDDAAGDYSSQLKGLVYEKVRLKDLLSMRSGVDAGSSLKHGDPYPQMSTDLRMHRRSIKDLLSEYNKIKEGEHKFEYNNLNLMAMGLVIEEATGKPLTKFFQETLVKNAGVQNSSFWLLDKEDKPINYAFLAASQKDWGRLGLHTIDLLKGKFGPCLKNYMEQAVAEQLPLDNSVSPAFNSYGYYFWTGFKNSSSPTFFMLGYGGQMLAVNLKSEKIMVAHSTEARRDLFGFFRGWTR